MIAGGGIYNNLDYSFSVGHEDGSGRVNAPGTGGSVFQKQLKIMKDFLDGFDFVRMKPDNSVITGGVPKKATARALVQRGRQYAIYVNGGARADLIVTLPRGTFLVEWVNTKTGKTEKRRTIAHVGGAANLSSPDYTDDIALKIVRTEK